MPHGQATRLPGYGARFVPARDLPDVMAPSQTARVDEALANRTLPALVHGQRAA
ncbi:hypothetical protein ACFWJ4_22575 [Kitasatospora sp. NPDC127067]|uniref:hypothetical protein n=1 Tax=Kitasatospora sp. NPDC127067 TaxID=3347126 RepID=UPI0036488CA0